MVTQMERATRVLIVDDHAVVRTGIRGKPQINGGRPLMPHDVSAPSLGA
jgi:hypothetical protein